MSVGVVGSYSRECANQVVARADLVCFVGTRTGGMTTHAWAVPSFGTPAIQIDIEPTHLGRICGELTAVLPADAGPAGMWMAQFHDITAPGQS